MNRFHPRKTLVLSFLAVILFGTMLLMLPVSNASGDALPVADALFTATSATCVTGLVVVDTGTQFSFFGQFIIMLLIQIGGLGFMTVAMLVPMALGRRIGLKDRFMLKETLNAAHLGGIMRMMRRIIIGTVTLEIAGAIFLSYRMIPLFGLAKGIWYSVFHSVSAFCNAGFDLMGILSPFSSFTSFSGDFLTSGVLMALIIGGGIGFIIWDDLIEKRFVWRKFSFHSRITLIFTAGLLLVSVAGFLLFEWNSTLSGYTWGGKMVRAMFQAVTPRTAGFNTVDLSAMSEGGIFLTMLLMIVGAGPGSTGGGVKVTTFAVMATAVLANLRGSKDSNFFYRRFSEPQIRRAFSLVAFYLFLSAMACLLIAALQSFSLKEIFYEVLSAIGTVGLSLGITRELIPASKLILVILMITGRLGSITVFLAMAERKQEALIRYPEEKVVV